MSIPTDADLRARAAMLLAVLAHQSSGSAAADMILQELVEALEHIKHHSGSSGPSHILLSTVFEIAERAIALARGED